MNRDNQQAFQKDLTQEEGIEYPLRQNWDSLKFSFYLIVIPALFTAAIAFLFAWLLFPKISIQYIFAISILHYFVLRLFLLLLWTPMALTILNWPDWIETSIVAARTSILVAAMVILFPHALIREFIIGGDEAPQPLWTLYKIFFASGIGIYLVFAYFNNRRTAFRDVRMATAPQGRKYSERWLWFDAGAQVLVLFAVIIIEIWIFAIIGNGEFEFFPYQRFMRAQPDMTELSWLCAGILCAMIYFLWACLPNRLMKSTLAPLTFHERDVEGLLFKSHRYLRHFVTAMLLKHPILLVGGVILTALFLAMPTILTRAGHTNMLAQIMQADEIIFALGVFIAWFVPIALAAVKPDETFGEYFDHRLANHIMMVQGHTVLIGYGDLGRRALDREINQMQILPQPRKMFFEIVSPDLRLEKLCSQAIVIEHDPKDIIYSGQNNLLGNFGVVSACQKRYRSRDARGNIIHPEKRVLVPVVIGEAKEPFISSRVNLERASLVISMVPDEESVQTVFERATKSNISSIICVTRSDQISYLTYRSRHHPIILVYPKHNQGIAIGERLWAAILKVRGVRGMTGKWWPRVLVVGNNRANHYMLERLWINLPGDHRSRNKILKRHFAFIVTATEGAQAHPVLKNIASQETYDQGWPATYITGGRYPYSSAEIEPEEKFNVPSRMVNASDIRALEDCLEEHRPEILVINHEEVDKSLIMLSRCMRALERIKTRRPANFGLPFILLSATRGNDWERLSLGDASRYYNALCYLHNEDLIVDLSYPEHAHFDHFQREQIGESIVDSLADVEEMIAGARATLRPLLMPPMVKSPASKSQRPAKPQFIEVNGCLPNRPGALATYISRLAGIDYEQKSNAEIDSLWRKINGLNDDSQALVPSYQYLRYVKFDPEQVGFGLSGYATLAPPENSLSAENENLPLVARVFANDGRHYSEHEDDPDAKKFTIDKALPKRVLDTIIEPLPPGVPQVIDRLTARKPAGSHNSVEGFHRIMLDPQPNKYNGQYACPGMTICRIAAFQDYVVASNSLRLQRLAADRTNPSYQNDKLLHVRNYYCCAGAPRATTKEIPNIDSAHARIFCCCRGEDKPGLIAFVLNLLLFRSNIRPQPATGDPEKDWVINVDYFKDISCQNPHFTLNRLFGSFKEKPRAVAGEPLVPLQVIRILPIGSVESARQWYYYARTLHAFLNGLQEQPLFRFYWMDETRAQREEINKPPEFDGKNRRSYPVVLVIERSSLKQQRHAASDEFCDLCGIQARDYDCRKLRAWV